MSQRRQKTTSYDEIDAKQRQIEEHTNAKLANAIKTVTLNKQRAETLHQQWRSHLLSVSYMVTLVSIHQARSLFDDWDVAAYRCEIVNVVLCVLTALFLYDLVKRASCSNILANYWYGIVSFTVILDLSLFFQMRSVDDGRERAFPAGVILYLIVSGACAFMNYGMKGIDGNLKLVRDLKLRLDETREQAKEVRLRKKKEDEAKEK
mmetsp:Transcript_38263/g.46700  ORF Transcript_38263/g.46700 Transcript_38263/m.46700 type:complete len:206 (-) Transcript_38263:77-694(-)|eukprot:CAMPEP_0172512564 /NCGR_PEP_ID=MMETSP1066-20121228/245632_1 /TAXON_ID=671091 /ORGANISM="Coscinodiscus wailesii, Strain CCMP2513" /LENGTH=205 /DNA_ID=CAMNT_0013292447 /DNA_START=228 /DNA_END=845 /DNA_ORIENTATION=-